MLSIVGKRERSCAQPAAPAPCLSVPKASTKSAGKTAPKPGRKAKSELELRRTQTEAILNVSRIQRELDRRVQSYLDDERLEGVTPAQANALMILFQAREAMTARQVAGEMSLSEVTVGRFVRALENGGWVERARDPSDSRAILISPSRKARRAFQRFVRVSNRLLEESFDGFGRKEVESLVALSQRIRENLIDE